jgi:hypothetical protein
MESAALSDGEHQGRQAAMFTCSCQLVTRMPLLCGFCTHSMLHAVATGVDVVLACSLRDLNASNIAGMQSTTH